MNTEPFLTVDELLALERMTALTRAEASWTRDAATAVELRTTADRVEGIITRHRAFTLRERAEAPS